MGKGRINIMAADRLGYFGSPYRKAGFSLIESLMAMAFTAIVLTSVVICIVKGITLAQMQKDRIIANSHLQRVMEEISSPTMTVNAIKTKGWSAWYSANIASLPNESLTLSYQDIGTNLIRVWIRIDWVCKGMDVSIQSELIRGGYD